MIDTIYLARHGFRLNWVISTWSNPTETPRDPPISVYGERQAAELAQHFAAMPPEARPTAIFSSPYYRCLQTAAPVAAALDLPVYVEHGLSEWYSPAAPGTGLHPRPLRAPALAAAFPALRIDAAAWPAPTWVPPRRGETIAAVHARCAAFLRAFVPRAEAQLPAHAHARVLLVSHAAPVIALTRALVGARDLAMRVACCSLTAVVRRPEDAAQAIGVWELRALAQGGFLTGGLERDWTFQDIEVQDGEVIDDPGVPGTEDEVEEDSGLQVVPPLPRM